MRSQQLSLQLTQPFQQANSFVVKNGSTLLTTSTTNSIEVAGTFLIARVIDGDTIVIESATHSTGSGQATSTSSGQEHVRYIGMNTPETVDPRKPVQCFGVEAANRNRELVEGKLVRLERDLSDRDEYGRLLRYVYLSDDTFVNLELVKEGYATAFTYPPDVKYASDFVAAEKEAREAKGGLWGGCKNN